MKNILTLISISLILTVTTCSSDKEVVSSKKLRKYYFPVEELEKPKVYYYKSGEKSDQHLFWKLSKKVEDGKTYLITDAFTYSENGEIQKVEEIKERITEEGSFVVKYVQYEYDDLGNTFKLNSTMKDSCVFKWEMTSEKEIEWFFSNESVIFENYTHSISKKRTLVGTDQKVNYNETKNKAIQFSDHFTTKYTNRSTGSVDKTYEMNQTSYYSKGIGMVKYNRQFEDGSGITFKLHDIMSLDEWNKKIENSDNIK